MNESGMGGGAQYTMHLQRGREGGREGGRREEERERGKEGGGRDYVMFYVTDRALFRTGHGDLHPWE